MTASPSVLPLQLGGGGYQISRSVRLRSSASAYFSRTMTTPTNANKWTWSGWVKRGSLGGNQNFFAAGQANTSADFGAISFAGDAIYIPYDVNGTVSWYLLTTPVYRDPSAWYHIVVYYDSTQATAANRVLIYVNGVQVTAFSSATYPTQNTSMYINTARGHAIGNTWLGATVGQYFDGYLAEVNFIDGQALTPSSFGTTDSNGIWQPKAYTGTYGTNGFYLKFTDNSAATAAAIGKDYSGNGNNWTPNNISVTAGTTYDSMIDSPTVGYAASNYCVLNPLNSSIPATLADANLSFSYGAAAWRQALSTFQLPASGKWYCEFTTGPSGTGGGVDIGLSDYLNATYRVYRSGGNKASNSGGSVAYGSAFSSAGTVVGIAVDATNGTITFYNNNTSQGVAFTDINSAVPATGWYLVFQANNASTQYVNFGQRPFSYTPPTGFAALNTYNLPAATINNGATVMAASTYTSNGTTQTITNNGNNAAAVSFKPDLVWTKARSSISNNVLNDSVRGAANYLMSNSTAAETAAATYLTSFDGSGYSIGAGNFFANSTTVVGWQWQAGQGTTSSNTNGSITSTVSVNLSAGFSIVTWTSTGSAATVGHGLGVAPKFIITKSRNAVQSWYVYHSAYGATQTTYLNLTDGAFTDSRVWNNTAPTSTVFSIGTIGPGAATTEVAYCWSEVAGYSKFGSYTGNGSTDGPFVYCGFRPRWIMWKCSSTTGNWIIEDTSRNTTNLTDLALFPNLSNAETQQTTTNSPTDVLSNGFKFRGTGADSNTNGATYIFAAFAENPFNISRAR